MVQKNEMSARALTMEEMENVNGGYPISFIDELIGRGGRSHRRQNRRRNRCDNLHNPLKSFLLCHTLLLLMISKLRGESRSPRPFFTFLPFYL